MSPLYEFECKECKDIQENIFKIKDCPQVVKCKQCGKEAKRIISIRGAILTDGNVKWLPSVVEQMRPDYDNRPIETRTDLKKYLKENGLVWTG